MAINQKQIKINTLAKDFNMKSKDVIDVLAAAGMDKKSSGTVDSDEFISHRPIRPRICLITSPEKQ